MGILNAIGSYSAAIGEGIDGMLRAHDERFIQKSREKSPGALSMRIRQRPYTVKNQFKVYDSGDNVIYWVKGSFLSPKPMMTIYLLDGSKVARVRQKMLALRSPLTIAGSPVDFEIELHDKKLGRLKSLEKTSYLDGPKAIFQGFKESWRQTSYVFDFNGWRVVHRIWDAEIDILTKEGSLLARCSSDIWDEGHYVISYTDPRNELLYLMAILAVDADMDTSTRRERIADARRHRRYRPDWE